MPSTDLVRLDVDGMERIARHLANSGQFGRSTPEQAFVAVLAGQELGIPPFASITGIHVIQGKPVIGAGLLAARVKASGRYDYRVKEHDEERCVIAFFEAGDHVGDSMYTMSEAKRAGLASKDNWRQYPRNMLFARAMSNGVAFFCPDVTAGRVYVEGEIEDARPVPFENEPRRGDFIDAKAVEVEVATNGQAPETFDHVPDSDDEVEHPDPDTVRAIMRGLDDAEKARLKQALVEAGFKPRTQGHLVAYCASLSVAEWDTLLARVAGREQTASDEPEMDAATAMFAAEHDRLAGIPAYGEGAPS